MAKIYLFRHGQSNYNLEKRFTGWQESVLTDLGKQHADNLGKMLQTKKIDLL